VALTLVPITVSEQSLHQTLIPIAIGIAMQHGTIQHSRAVPNAFGMKRPIGLVLHDIETIMYPYTVLIKSMVHALSVLQLVSGSGKRQNP
jgi:hypothetical protein